MENAHTMNDLRQYQAMPLPVKVAMTKTRIRAWVNEYGSDGVYVSFSGGKDSTVLLHIVRELYPDIPGVFVDTGLEYPEIREFVKTFDNIVWLRPKMNFRQVIEKYGYPFISKEISHKIGESQKWCEKNNIKYPYSVNVPKLDKKLLSGRLASLCGFFEKDWGRKKKTGEFNDEDISAPFLQSRKWLFAIDAPFHMSHKCCSIMKKAPMLKYHKETGRVSMTAQMASESRLRTAVWLRYGCNIFQSKSEPISNPMSFWMEQDVLQYIKENNLPIASVYGEIVPDNGSEEFEGQMDISELGLIEDNRPLKTTGCNRTGCMFCGFGCHMESNPNRFERMKITHPKQYEYIMRDWDKGGLGYKKVIDWINEHGNMNIRY